MDLMIQLKNLGYVSADKEQNGDKINGNENDNSQKMTKLSMNEIMAQSFVFFAAGKYFTGLSSSSSISKLLFL